MQIAVHQDDRRAQGLPHAAGEGHLRAEVAAVRDHGDALVAPSDIEQNLFGVVGTVVVDEDDLVLGRDLREDFRQPAVHLADVVRIPVAGHHYRNQLVGQHGETLASCATIISATCSAVSPFFARR